MPSTPRAARFEHWKEKTKGMFGRTLVSDCLAKFGLCFPNRGKIRDAFGKMNVWIEEYRFCSVSTVIRKQTLLSTNLTHVVTLLK